MLKRRQWSARFKITRVGEEEPHLEISGDLDYDPELGEFPHNINLYGYRSDHIGLLTLVGYLVHVSVLGEDDGYSTTFLGRLHDAGWTSSTADDQIVKIGNITIDKSINERKLRGSDEKKRLTYVFTADVKTWPGRGLYGLSYEGTIELRRFNNGIGNLYKEKDLQIEAYPNFYFKDEERKTVRSSLACVVLQWNRDDLDWQRYVRCARIALSFSHVVKLRPMALSHVQDGTLRRVSWDATLLETEAKGVRDGPISPPDQKKFHRQAIRALGKHYSEYEIIDSIVDRYIECRTDVALERSFAHGCEAIEGLCGLLTDNPKKRKKSKSHDNLIKSINDLIRHSDFDKSVQDVALSRVPQLFNPPVWPRIVALVKKLEKDQSATIIRVINRANFYRYRNFLAHGRVVRLENEVVFQARLMRYVIEWLFIKLCGSDAMPMLQVSQDELDAPVAPDLGLISLWE